MSFGNKNGSTAASPELTTQRSSSSEVIPGYGPGEKASRPADFSGGRSASPLVIRIGSSPDSLDLWSLVSM
jgi:hypothetical protein